MKQVTIGVEALERLRDAAQVANDDLVSGLADGSYDEDSIRGHTSDEIEDAIAAADALLA